MSSWRSWSSKIAGRTGNRAHVIAILMAISLFFSILDGAEGRNLFVLVPDGAIPPDGWPQPHARELGMVFHPVTTYPGTRFDTVRLHGRFITRRLGDA
jgi:hypothetical protein